MMHLCPWQLPFHPVTPTPLAESQTSPKNIRTDCIRDAQSVNRCTPCEKSKFLVKVL
ncbi:hypothetical protein THTE_2105 [Thermogutta terrifontis]|uniref:Uncharacterized protein n=1 Tax=Thermogutta terrifontis TaxID=1331910 RepID=A0A286RFI4_9BACT|nr:hypothetical protein THTE_2105 [Thermogutta terrifontis]